MIRANRNSEVTRHLLADPGRVGLPACHRTDRSQRSFQCAVRSFSKYVVQYTKQGPIKPNLLVITAWPACAELSTRLDSSSDLTRATSGRPPEFPYRFAIVGIRIYHKDTVYLIFTFPYLTYQVASLTCLLTESWIPTGQPSCQACLVEWCDEAFDQFPRLVLSAKRWIHKALTR
jgi:hypothetical protein